MIDAIATAPAPPNIKYVGSDDGLVLAWLTGGTNGRGAAATGGAATGGWRQRRPERHVGHVLFGGLLLPASIGFGAQPFRFGLLLPLRFRLLALGFRLPLRLGLTLGLRLRLALRLGLTLCFGLAGALCFLAPALLLTRLFFGALRLHGRGRDGAFERPRLHVTRIDLQHLVDQQRGVFEPPGRGLLLRPLHLPLHFARFFMRFGLLRARLLDGLPQRFDPRRFGVHAEHALGQQPRGRERAALELLLRLGQPDFLDRRARLLFELQRLQILRLEHEHLLARRERALVIAALERPAAALEVRLDLLGAHLVGTRAQPVDGAAVAAGGPRRGRDWWRHRPRLRRPRRRARHRRQNRGRLRGALDPRLRSAHRLPQRREILEPILGLLLEALVDDRDELGIESGARLGQAASAGRAGSRTSPRSACCR